jgi:hypothetical protein
LLIVHLRKEGDNPVTLFRIFLRLLSELSLNGDGIVVSFGDDIPSLVPFCYLLLLAKESNMSHPQPHFGYWNHFKALM